MKKEDFSIVYFYQIRHGKFRVLIQELEGCFDCWLNHDQIGIMEYMFGLPNDGKITLEHVIDIIEHNFKDYLESYRNEYIDCEED